MSVPSGTFIKYDAKGLREQLSDAIYNISPEDTPFMSAIGRGPKAKGTLVEWQTDSLAAVDTTNAQVEGDDASYTTPAATVRVGNYTQISRKTLSLSGSLQEHEAAGRKDEEAYQMQKRSAELKRDMEAILLTNQGADAGGSTTARKIASMGAWLKTNVDKASDGSNPTYTSGVPLAGRTDGTQRAFTETIAKNVIQLAWSSGGSPRTLMCGPVNKAKVSAFSGIATRNFDLSNVAPKATAIIAAADVYVSDFGTLRVIPNRFQRERDAWVLDFEMLSVRMYRPFKREKMAKTGDADKTLLLVEWTLQVNQEAALGAAFDLTTS